MNPTAEEVELLRQKIADSEDLVERAEAYYAEHNRDWSIGVAAQFEKFLERKRDQIHFEQHLLERMGWRVALAPDSEAMDI